MSKSPLNEMPENFLYNFSIGQKFDLEYYRYFESWHTLENEDISSSSFYEFDFDKNDTNPVLNNNQKETSNTNNSLLQQKRNNLNLEPKKEEKEEENCYDKNNLDNFIRRIKKLAFNSILKYDNKVISEMYNNRLGHGINIKKLLKNNHFQIKCTGTIFNKELLKKTQGEILSENITTRFTNFPRDHNKNLIINLLNEEDKVKKERFNNLFNKTLSECIDHLIGVKKSKDLEGLEKIFENELKNIKKTKEYIENLKNIFNDYKKIYDGKIPRKMKSKKKY